MELADYNIMFVHIKGKNNVLVDSIPWLETLNIYDEPLEKPKAQGVNNAQVVMVRCATNMHTVSTSMLSNEETWDKTCKIIASQISNDNINSLKSVTMSASGIL